MDLAWEDLVIEKGVLDKGRGSLFEDWKWLIPLNANPILLTACGDAFFEHTTSEISLLDTVQGTFSILAPNYDAWKIALNDQKQFRDWFLVEFLADLLSAKLARKKSECFSPLLPQKIGGSWDPANFKACDPLVHFSVLGQIHRQVKDLPEGTKISGFDVKWD